MVLLIESKIRGNKSKEKLVSIVIINYNGKEDTLKFLKSLRKTDYPNYEIIVVDNASNDGSAAAIRKRFPKVRVVHNKKNRGYAGGLNSGIKNSKGEYIVTLVNDMIAFQKSWLTELVKVAESDEKIGMVASVWVDCDNPDMIQHRFYLKLGKTSEKILEILGGAFFGAGTIESGQSVIDSLPDVLDIRLGNGMIKRSVIKKIGMFDEKMFIYFEEVDFCYRMRKAGYRTVLATKSKLQHAGGASTKKENRYFSHYHFYKNKIRFMMKNYGFFTRTFAIAVDLPYFGLLITKYILTKRSDLARAIRDAILWNIKNWNDYVRTSIF